MVTARKDETKVSVEEHWDNIKKLMITKDKLPAGNCQEIYKTFLEGVARECCTLFSIEMYTYSLEKLNALLLEFSNYQEQLSDIKNLHTRFKQAIEKKEKEKNEGHEREEKEKKERHAREEKEKKACKEKEYEEQEKKMQPIAKILYCIRNFDLPLCKTRIEKALENVTLSALPEEEIASLGELYDYRLPSADHKNASVIHALQKIGRSNIFAQWLVQTLPFKTWSEVWLYEQWNWTAAEEAELNRLFTISAVREEKDLSTAVLFHLFIIYRKVSNLLEKQCASKMVALKEQIKESYPWSKKCETRGDLIKISFARTTLAFIYLHLGKKEKAQEEFSSLASTDTMLGLLREVEYQCEASKKKHYNSHAARAIVRIAHLIYVFHQLEEEQKVPQIRRIYDKALSYLQSIQNEIRVPFQLRQMATNCFKIALRPKSEDLTRYQTVIHFVLSVALHSDMSTYLAIHKALGKLYSGPEGECLQRKKLIKYFFPSKDDVTLIKTILTREPRPAENKKEEKKQEKKQEQSPVRQQETLLSPSWTTVLASDSKTDGHLLINNSVMALLPLPLASSSHRLLSPPSATTTPPVTSASSVSTVPAATPIP